MLSSHSPRTPSDANPSAPSRASRTPPNAKPMAPASPMIPGQPSEAIRLLKTSIRAATAARIGSSTVRLSATLSWTWFSVLNSGASSSWGSVHWFRNRT